MVRVLVVSHSAEVRDAALWMAVLRSNPLVDLIVPQLSSLEYVDDDQRLFFELPQVTALRAYEPFGAGHSSMWIKGLLRHANRSRYDLVHAAFEPWSLIPQALCGKIPTVIQGAESVVKDAHWVMKARRLGTSRVLKKSAGVLTWGTTSLKAFQLAGLPPATPQGVIPMGVPSPKLFSPTKIDISPGPLRLLFVGRLVEEKGILTLIRAICAFAEPAHLRVLGEGPMLNVLVDISKNCPTLTLQIDGNVSGKGVASAMSWAQVVVVPSEPTSSWREQWGRVAVEAMLSARPTIVSDSGELPFIASDSSLVFPAGDYEALANILRRLNSNRVSLEPIGISSHKAVHRFSPDFLASRINEFWLQAAQFATSKPNAEN